MAYVILTLAIMQLIIAIYNFTKVPRTLPTFFLMYGNFCTMFLTFITAFIMLSK